MNAIEVQKMTVKATVCTAVAVLIGAISNASAGEFYSYEKTNNLFTVDAGAANLDTSVWTKPTGGGTASVDSGNDQIVLDTDLDYPLIYVPGGNSDEIAFVKARIVVSPNETTPGIDGLSEAQAALTTVTNTANECLDWYGLVRSSGTDPEWVALDGNHPVVGDTYDIIITLDNRDGQKKVRYSVKGPGASSYVNLTSGGDAWLDNPKSNKSYISAVAFSGVGRFGDFSADSVLDDGTTIDSTGEVAGFDFKDGKVTAVVTVPSAEYSGKTAVLSVVDFATGNTTTYDPQTLTGEALSWDLSNLTPGGTYSYTVTVKDGGDVRTAKSGTFTAANWGTAGSWFSATASGGAAVNHNGIWEDTYLVPAPTPTNETQLSIYGDASFLITDKDPGTNAVSRVDTKYQFETFVSTNALITTEDAVSGIVAATNDVGVGAWYVYKTGGWTKLDDGVVPNSNTPYIMRAEFDFMSATKRVRYMISTDNGASFTPMTLGGDQWINLVDQDKTTLSAVSISGRGILTSILATISDRHMAEGNDGTPYDTLWDAIKAGATEPIKLLTNTTLKPSDVSGRVRFRVNNNGFDLKYDNTNSSKWWLHKKGDVWYLTKVGGTYIFL